MLETRGYGVVGDAELAPMKRSRYAIYRKLGDFGTYLRGSLELLATRRRVIYSDDHMLIFELGPARQTPAPNDLVTAHDSPGLIQEPFEVGARTALSARNSGEARTVADKAVRAPILDQAHDPSSR